MNVFEDLLLELKEENPFKSFLAGGIRRDTDRADHIMDAGEFIPFSAIEERAIAYDCEL